MENLRLQLAGAGGVSGDQSAGLGDQLGGGSMALQAFNLKLSQHNRHTIMMGIQAAFLRVLGQEDERSRDIMGRA